MKTVLKILVSIIIAIIAMAIVSCIAVLIAKYPVTGGIVLLSIMLIFIAWFIYYELFY